MTTRTTLGTALALTLLAGLASATPQGRAKPEQRPTTAAPRVSLTTKEFPDGTGTIGLPAGWSIEGSYRGTVGCNGPESQKAIMGMAFVIGRPNHPANNQGIPYSGPMGRDGDLAGALKAVLEKSGTRLLSLRTREAPSPAPGIPAAFFLYEMESKGKRTMALGYFSAIIDETQTLPYWQLYSSAVIAPKATFIKEFGTLMAIYGSYRPNGKAPREGSDGALIDEAIKANLKARRETLKSQQEAFDRMNERFKSVIQQ
ncbi:hypothetical protein [Armatimonas rosea]|uniref:Uncharacterized protein n=1 Tax=Armatimonas rosea TaxID=685828 RepID=A0A7W9W8L9_ARMRO|nr:hypothetical protein [Armatimonas rosea]MBB6053689.1 hypothetical protein [Armatimonas rosea]